MNQSSYELTRFLPDYPMQGHVVTVEHLLNHTSGIKSYTGLGQRWQAARPVITPRLASSANGRRGSRRRR